MIKNSSDRKIKSLSYKIFLYSFCIFFAFLCLFPFWVLIVNSTRSSQQIQQSLSILPSTHLVSNWDNLVGRGFDIWRAFLNSLFIALSSTLLSMYFSALTAHGFNVYNFKGKKLLFTIILLVIMLPGQLGLIGFYQFMIKLNLTDSFIPLIIPAIASAGTVFFLRQYFQSNVSIEIIQAARIDGAREFSIFNFMVIPIVTPAIATLSIFSIVGSWNNYIMPLILLDSPSKYTMPIMVQMLKTDIYSTNYGSVYLGIFLTILPLLIIYFILSKYIIRGVALGGIKG